MPVAKSRVCAALRLDSTILQSGWYPRSATGSESRHDLPPSPPGPRGPRSGRVVLFRPSSLNRPHPPVRRTPHHFPVLPVIGTVRDIHRIILSVLLTFRTFTAELSGIAAVCTPGIRCVLTSVLPHRRWPSGRAEALGIYQFPRKSDSMRGALFVASTIGRVGGVVTEPRPPVAVGMRIAAHPPHRSGRGR